MKQADMICVACPLGDCNEDSVWCAFRWATNPNEAQQRLINRFVARKGRVNVKRSEYFAQYHQDNREKRNKAALDRYYARKADENSNSRTTTD